VVLEVHGVLAVFENKTVKDTGALQKDNGCVSCSRSASKVCHLRRQFTKASVGTGPV
jgi:hypothetical protein